MTGLVRRGAGAEASLASAGAAGAAGAGGAADAVVLAEAGAAPLEPLRSFCLELFGGLLDGGGGLDGAVEDEAGWLFKIVGAACEEFFAVVGGLAVEVCVWAAALAAAAAFFAAFLLG